MFIKCIVEEVRNLKTYISIVYGIQSKTNSNMIYLLFGLGNDCPRAVDKIFKFSQSLPIF